MSISMAPYDGYAPEEALASLARCGARFVEPAFIVGYTEPFDETAFGPAAATAWRGRLSANGQRCHAVSAHIDLGRDDAVGVFLGRMDFAKAIGAEVIATNAAVVANAASFWRNIDPLARHAEDIALSIGLENPGDGRPNLIDTAAAGAALVARIGSPRIALNFDPGNTVSHLPDGPDPAAEFAAALPACAHAHVKDVRRTPDGWFFTPIGDGDIDCASVLADLRARPDLPFSIEIPLRLHRGPDSQPVRRPARVPLAEIEAAVQASLAAVHAGLAGEP